MATLKIQSRALDSFGEPRTQVWLPGVAMVSRIGKASWDEFRRGCWALYDHSVEDYVSPTPPSSFRVEDVRVGMEVDTIPLATWGNVASDSSPARGRFTVASTTRMQVGYPGASDYVQIGFAGIDGTVGYSRDYSLDTYLTVADERSRYVEEFRPDVTLLAITFWDGRHRYIVCEQGWLLNREGATLDRVAF